MNVVKINRLITAAGLMLAISGVLPAANTAGLKLDGTWLVTVNVNSPAPGVPAFSFRGLNTFLANGGMIVSDGNNAAPQGPQSQSITATAPGQGEWILIGDHLFVATTYQFRFDQNRQFAGLLRIRQIITLAPAQDQFTSVFTADVMDASGNVVGAVSGMAKAARIDVLSPDARP